MVEMGRILVEMVGEDGQVGREGKVKRIEKQYV